MSIVAVTTAIALAPYSPALRRRLNALGTIWQFIGVTGDVSGGTMQATCRLPASFAQRYILRLLAYYALRTTSGNNQYMRMNLGWTARTNDFNDLTWSHETVASTGMAISQSKGGEYPLWLPHVYIESRSDVSLNLQQNNGGVGEHDELFALWQLVSDYSEKPGEDLPGPP